MDELIHMQTLKKALFAVFLIGVFFVTCTPAYAQESNLKASVRSTDPLKPILVLTNISTEPCQVVQSDLGTVSVTKVVQDGKEISSIPIDVAFDESLDVVLAKRLHTLKPGETIEIPLQVFKYKSGYALQAITWSHDAGAFGMIYPLQGNKPYTLEVTYAAPITVSSGPPLCGIATGTNASAAPDMSSFIKPVAMGVALILFIMLLIWLFRFKKRKAVVTTALLICVFLSPIGINRAVQADYSVPDSASTQFNECMGVLNAHRDITGPVLDALAGAHVVIIPTDDGTNDTTVYPDGSFHIYWDPDHTYNYYSDDGTTIVSTPCDRLFHEMYHAFELINHTFSRDLCDGSDVETKEVNAVRAQNRLRAALGLAPRTHYGRDRLPSGDCTPHATPTCTGGGCAELTGDPHLRTFDKLRYDFQAVGEFIAARDPKGDFEVQTRQQPWSTSRNVSLNTGVAMRVGANRVELQMHEGQLSLLVNGKLQPFQDTTLDDGGTIVPTGANSVTITWPDGSNVMTNTIGNFGLYISVDPAQTRAGKLEGILGNFNGASKDDLKARGNNSIITPEFEKLYPSFADSWRVDDKSSLFTYDKGKSTKTYTNRSFPDKPVTAKDLPNRAVAEALCKSLGVTDPEILENCILDVALTGRPEFARAASIGQHMTSSTDYGGKTWTVKINKPGDAATVPFDGKANDKIFLDVSQSTLPDQCGNLTLIDSDKNTISSGCIIGGRGMIDGIVLPKTGTYTISVSTTEDKTGTAFLRLINIKDQKGTITPDTGEVVAHIDKPGVTAEFNFDGKAGQHVFVDIPTSALPDQCGGFGIKGPDGVISSGCVINGKGFVDATQLPVTGTYTVFVDPAERNTGQATLRLLLAEDYKANVTLGGAVTARLTKPGSVAVLTFSGTAGQRVFVKIPSSTLPDQCGGITLHAPDDSSLDSGCIINHKGGLNEKGIVLPQTGNYTIKIDPAEDKTGEVTVRAHL